MDVVDDYIAGLPRSCTLKVASSRFEDCMLSCLQRALLAVDVLMCETRKRGLIEA